jgi:hypothetical protein
MIGADFTRSSDTCANATLGAKKKCTVAVQFAPLSGTPTGPVTGETLSYGFTYGAGLSGNVSVALKGTVK